MIGEVIKDVIVFASLFSIGLVGYLGWRNTAIAFREHGVERRLNAAYALARFGFVITVSIVAEAVLRSPEISASARVIGYTIGVVMAAIGYGGVVYESRKLPISSVLRPDAPRDPRQPRGPVDERDERRKSDERDKRRLTDPVDPRDPRQTGSDEDS